MPPENSNGGQDSTSVNVTPASSTPSAAPTTPSPFDVRGWYGQQVPEAQQWLSETINGYSRELEGLKGHATLGSGVTKMFEPYADLMKQHGVEPLVVLDNWMKTIRGLQGDSVSKARTIRNIAQMYEIDLKKASETDPHDPYGLAAQVQKLTQDLTTLRGSMNDRSTQDYTKVVDDFAATPGHEHLEALTGTIIKVLSAGLATDLDSAYRYALSMQPELTQGRPTPKQSSAVVKRTKRSNAKAVQGAKPEAVPKEEGSSIRELLESQM